jgi:alcohol dehydrogenase class IV
MINHWENSPWLTAKKPVMEANVNALRKQALVHPVLERYATIGKLLSGDEAATAATGIRWVRDFCQHAQVPSLSVYGFTEAMFDKTLEKAVKASSMKGNPVILSAEELRSILRNAM